MTELHLPDLGPAPELATDRWLNSHGQAISLSQLSGQVVAIEAFQMLCPGCVSHGLPQAQRLARAFGDRGLVVLGLHSVFEHHAAMTPTALEAFIHEYRIGFPVAIDQPGADGSPLPETMRRYALRGTPSLLLIDAAGRLRANHFGAVDDLPLGAQVATLLAEAGSTAGNSPARDRVVA